MSQAYQYTQKLHPGSPFPDIQVTLPDGSTRPLAQANNDQRWQLVLVYRGRHCPLCTRYLNELEQFKDKLAAIGVDIVAVSGDSLAQLQSHSEQLNVSFELGYGLSLEQMNTLGLFISDPRSAQETDHPFAEPGLFVVNEVGNIQVADISNNPFVRPDLTSLVNGLAWIRDPDNNYPIRGMHR
ncbi:redoxin domain-containing protein [Pseudoalteromonas viridis]|uniref:Redoxin domain-containing protein n=1 Tax=Pseudoalteromonas viridis TaxID=339617 RepID=A0ABX7V1K4_9GAMM|nr:redoxin domain-containing protein [Pseudoalteromonas viridis]QTL34365.1 redoxin domain-containing protein [Pseudoalteromonas viridis]